MISEAMVRQIIGVEGAQVLIEIVRGGWQDHLNEGRPRFHRSTRAHVVWDYMVQRADESLAGMDGVRRIERQDRPLYILRDLIMVRPKLHTRDMRTRNYPTTAQSDVERTGLYPEIDCQNVTFGYKLDRAEAGVEACVVTSPSDSWVINLEELAAGELRPVTGLLDMPELDQTWVNVPSIRLRR